MPRAAGAAGATPGTSYGVAPELEQTPVPPVATPQPAYNGPALRQLSPAQRSTRTATAQSVAKAVRWRERAAELAQAAEEAHLRRIAAQQGVAPPAARGKPNRAGGPLRS